MLSFWHCLIAATHLRGKIESWILREALCSLNTGANEQAVPDAYQAMTNMVTARATMGVNDTDVMFPSVTPYLMSHSTSKPDYVASQGGRNLAQLLAEGNSSVTQLERCLQSRESSGLPAPRVPAAHSLQASAQGDATPGALATVSVHSVGHSSSYQGHALDTSDAAAAELNAQESMLRARDSMTQQSQQDVHDTHLLNGAAPTRLQLRSMRKMMGLNGIEPSLSGQPANSIELFMGSSRTGSPTLDHLIQSHLASVGVPGGGGLDDSAGSLTTRTSARAASRTLSRSRNNSGKSQLSGAARSMLNTAADEACIMGDLPVNTCAAFPTLARASNASGISRPVSGSSAVSTPHQHVLQVGQRAFTCMEGDPRASVASAGAVPASGSAVTPAVTGSASSMSRISMSNNGHGNGMLQCGIRFASFSQSRSPAAGASTGAALAPAVQDAGEREQDTGGSVATAVAPPAFGASTIRFASFNQRASCSSVHASGESAKSRLETVTFAALRGGDGQR